MEFKQRKTIFVKATGTATGLFNNRVDVEFTPKYCIVRQISYDIDHDLLIIKAPFIQGGILGCISGVGDTTPNNYLKPTGDVQGTYQFQVQDVEGVPVDMTATAVSQIAIVLEFVA